jgi:hypothetical protein
VERGRSLLKTVGVRQWLSCGKDFCHLLIEQIFPSCGKKIHPVIGNFFLRLERFFIFFSLLCAILPVAR